MFTGNKKKKKKVYGCLETAITELSHFHGTSLVLVTAFRLEKNRKARR